MHDDMYWLATDPRDIKRDDWAVDAYHYSWACSANEVARAGRLEKPEQVADYLADIAEVNSPFSCMQFRNKWLAVA